MTLEVKSTLETYVYIIYLLFQQYSCCQYGIVPSNDAADNGSMGGYDCLMIPGNNCFCKSFAYRGSLPNAHGRTRKKNVLGEIALSEDFATTLCHGDLYQPCLVLAKERHYK